MSSSCSPEQISVEIVSPPDKHSYRVEYIQQLLASEINKAGHGKTYSGRPATNIIADSENVLKLRTEYNLDEKSSRKFIQSALAKENELAIHHPQKCWFVLKNETEETCVIGNVTPKLFSLNQFLNSDSHKSEKLKIITAVVGLYLKIAKNHQLSLDLDLSNFAIDQGGGLFYLDDEVYNWIDFNPLVDFLAHLFRTGVVNDNALATELAFRIRNLVTEYFSDLHNITVISESLKLSYMSEQQRDYLKVFRDEFNKDPGYQIRPHKSASRIALLADIHANKPALDAVLAYLAAVDVEQILVLGDVVGYGPHPNECVETLSKIKNLLVIRGNHDHSAISGVESGGITSLASWSLDWTRAQLHTEAKKWLMKTPPYLQAEKWLAVHGAPIDKTFFNAYVYQMSYVENLDTLKQRNIPICFHGHTHIQKIYYRTRFEDAMSSEHLQSLKDYQYSLICPGSVGQPRNKKIGAEFAIIDLDSNEIDFHKIDYDIETTLKDMQRQSFPQKMIERLSMGE